MEALQREIDGRIKAMIGMWQVSTSISGMINSAPLAAIPREIGNALKVLASHGNDDRCALFLLTVDRLYLDRAHAWAAPGTRPFPNNPGRLRLDACPWLRERIEGLSLVHLPRVGDLPPEAEGLKGFLEAQGVRSMLIVPLAHGGVPMGCLVMESMTRHKTWDSGSVSLLRAAAGILANACTRKKVEEELSSCRAHLLSLSSDLLLAEEKERRRIASGLHDRIGHALAATSMKLKRLEKKASPDLCEAVHDISGLVDDLIRETQTLTFSISPPVLYDFGLEAAVEWLVEDTRRQHGLTIGLSCSIDDGRVDTSSRVLAYQAIRELLFNTVKHAQARSVHISITADGTALCAVIEDDGQGFTHPETPGTGERRGGFGLFNLRKRLSSRGGTLRVESHPNRGTTVTMISPLSGQVSAEGDNDLGG